MASKVLPPPDVLRQLLRYEPDTGKLFWRSRTPEMFAGGERPANSCAIWNSRFSGKEAMTAVDPNGYRRGHMLGATHLAHRVIWALVTGTWPEHEVDHIDNAPGNNRWSNLRQATRTENCRNTRSRANATSRYLGVHWLAREGVWHSQIKVDKKKMPLGYFKDEADAARAYDKAALAAYGAFANLNFPQQCF